MERTPWIERRKEYWPKLNQEFLEPDEDCLKELKGINLSQDQLPYLVSSRYPPQFLNNQSDRSSIVK